RETDQRLWRVIDHYVSKAREAVDMSEVQAIGVDETNSRRGHDYISLFVDLAAKRLLFATPGKDAQTFEKFC
ncbi:transposase, partial [Acidithiobacillus caldus ATCC 51756]